ncbi:hypothetical protein PCE1_001220 [Barthelona sp. PCE]
MGIDLSALNNTLQQVFQLHFAQLLDNLSEVGIHLRDYIHPETPNIKINFFEYIPETRAKLSVEENILCFLSQLTFSGSMSAKLCLNEFKIPVGTVTTKLPLSLSKICVKTPLALYVSDTGFELRMIAKPRIEVKSKIADFNTSTFPLNIVIRYIEKQIFDFEKFSIVI